jgi:hypothetical protein
MYAVRSHCQPQAPQVGHTETSRGQATLPGFSQASTKLRDRMVSNFRACNEWILVIAASRRHVDIKVL